MNNQDLAVAISAAHGLSQKDGKTIVDTVISKITSSLRAGEEVSLAGFGKFKVVNLPGRDGRNPRTGEIMQFAASNKAKFSSAKGLKDALNA